MNSKSVTLIGSTGLVGSHLLELLQEDPEIEKINILVRRSMQTDHPKTSLVVIDFSDRDAFKSAIGNSDIIFCAIGTTRKKVKGDQKAYRKVDFDIPVNAAKFGAEQGCQTFLLVSSLSADSSSGNFYLKLKGEVEDAIREVAIPSVYFFRPSFLMGKRKEFRFGELLGIIFMRPLSFLLPSRVRPIKALDVAKAMVREAKSAKKGRHVLHRKEMCSRNPIH